MAVDRIFNGYIDIEKWVSELHEDYAESGVASIFAMFSTMMNAAVKARCIPVSPCPVVRVTSGVYATDTLVATPGAVAARCDAAVPVGGR